MLLHQLILLQQIQTNILMTIRSGIQRIPATYSGITELKHLTLDTGQGMEVLASHHLVMLIMNIIGNLVIPFI